MQPTAWILDTSSAEDVAKASFQTVRRGYDPIEVQGFARAVSAEIVRLQSQVDDLRRAVAAAEAKSAERITEATVAGYLGEETARMLAAARETADHLTSQAEQKTRELTTTATRESTQMISSAQAEADHLRQEADLYSRRTRSEADQYAADLRRETEDFAARTRQALRAEADATLRQASAEADRLIREAMEHRVGVLRELARRRDLACAQVRSILAGRDMVVEALEQVRLSTIELIDGLEDISASPADFVSLDPSVEGPGLTVERGTSLAVHRVRRNQASEDVDTGEVELVRAPAARPLPAGSR